MLLGRSSRCDGAEIAAFRHPSVSRVHALLLEHEGVLHWIDCGSTNGVLVGTHCERLVALTPGTFVTLPSGASVCSESAC